MAGEIRLPDIGDFKDVPIIEILVKPGQSVAKEEVDPDARKRQGDARRAGAGGRRDRRDQGQGRRQGEPGRAAGDLDAGRRGAAAGCRLPSRPRRPPPPGARGQADFECDVLVLGAGPGRLHRRLPRRRSRRRTSCWSTGARRSAASASTSAASRPRRLLHAAKVIDEAAEMCGARRGLRRAARRPRRPARLEGAASSSV